MNGKAQALQDILDKSVDNRKIFGTSFCVKYKGEIWTGASGNLDVDRQYFIASTTKLFVTAMVLHLRSQGLLGLEDKISRYLHGNILHGLHNFNGVDHSRDISVRHLLAHTSGIPDYFQQKDESGESVERGLMKGADRGWTSEEAIALSKKLKPLFAPGTKRKAHYSDTNFQLLGKIIEQITGKSFASNCDTLICKPLGLDNTYLYQDVLDKRPQTLYYKDSALLIPGAMASFGPDGGIVATSGEMMVFLEAFFSGVFFPADYLPGLMVWNRIFFPMQSGIGIHRFRLPWVFNPLGTVPALVGHSGLSGALAYHSPEKDLYITGTVNQVAFPDTSFRLAIKLIQKVLRG